LFFNFIDTKSANFNIRKEVQVDASVRDLSNAWKSKKTDDKLFLGGDVNIVTDPFRCCVVKDFIGEKVIETDLLGLSINWSILLNGLVIEVSDLS
jgi:hypothetical protein